MTPSLVDSKRAIEALRSGVPSRYAVSQLGTTQTEVHKAFAQKLQAAAAGRGATPLVISGNFGSGKSHLLEYLQSVAEGAGFVTSLVVISPEMPLGNAHVVLKAIAENARAPHRVGKALRAVSPELRDEQQFRDVKQWVSDSMLPDRFLALVHLYERFRADEELRYLILGDFEGKQLNKSVIAQKLREAGDSPKYEMPPVRSALLAHDRIRLLAKLFQSSGNGGLVVLFDELERTAKFSTKQRLAAYQELGWWRTVAELAGSRIIPVFAMTNAFVGGSISGGSRDLERLDNGDNASTDIKVVAALRGAEMLMPPMPHFLNSTSAADERAIYERVREIYRLAYGGDVGEIKAKGVIRTSIRATIRRWITLWDMQRYYGDTNLELRSDPVEFDTSQIDDATLNAFENDDDIG